jgi:circadian clock protein KaiC
MTEKVRIARMSTGIPGLDEVLGGGIPELSFTLIAGGPGCGKTTMGNQIMFANASPGRKALYVTIIGEPPIKMLRYQQQFSFFDVSKVEESVRFVHLGDDARSGGLDAVLSRIEEETAKWGAKIVVVDSFRGVVQRDADASAPLQVQDFMQRLSLLLTTSEATTFLLGEYDRDEHDTSVFTVADGIIWLDQAVHRNSVVRKVQVAKMRGQAQIPGLHTARISDDGLSVFPRIVQAPTSTPMDRPVDHRLSVGTPELDVMLGGGVPRGYSVLLAGPSGSGKTVLANQFILEGAQQGENGVIAVFERRPNDYLQTLPQGKAFDELVREKKLEIVYLRPLDLSIDETLLALREAVERVGAKRAVIDSLSGLELALAPTFREDFRESLYRMIGALTGRSITVMSTVELADSYVDLPFSPAGQGVAFLTDIIILQRYLELEGQLRRVLSIVKVRGSHHSKDLREYEIGPDGRLVVGEKLSMFEALLTGSPTRVLRQTHAAGKATARTSDE